MQKLCCSLCKASKDETQFSKQAKSKTGRQTYCKPCAKDIKYRSRYGLTSQEVGHMLNAQRHTCAVCTSSLSSFVVDHDHSTGEVRSLLCNACNVMLGQARDNPSILRMGAEYLERMKR